MGNEVDLLLFERVKQYAIEKHEPDLLNILENVNKDLHFSVTIHFVLLLEVCPMACEAILANSAKYLPLFDSALAEAATQLCETSSRVDKHCFTKKKFIHFRVIGLPLSPDIESSTMPKLKDNGRFLCIQGTVIKSSQPKILEYQKEYSCTKCGFEFLVSADYDQYYSLKFPTSCPNPKKCRSTKFQPVNKGVPFHRKDYQEVKVQEPLSKLGVGTIPSSIWVTLEDDLVDRVTPGDDVTVCGLVSYRWMPVVRNQRASIEVVVKANSILVNNNAKVSSEAVNDDLIKQFQAFWIKYASNPLSGRNTILSSFAPQIYGMYLVKLATAIVICGGVTRHDDSGIKSRGESHLLLIGDPGAGKSQILKYVSKLCSRSVLTTGIGTTSAGLTVSASKESGTWHLEAGALVMADGGICCIDEFSSIQERDRASIHEAMEQQTISIAKAGMVCKLNTRCTIIAATNPKGGRYDSTMNLNINAGLATPLLSRFDLIMVLADRKDAAWDEIVAQHILNQNAIVTSESSNMWSFEAMKSYFSLVKNLKPVLTNEANEVLCKYYFALRQADERQTARTTVRMFESLIRLAQGHARLMFREKVTVMDAVVVITIMESSMQTGGLLNCENSFHSAFPLNPMEEYYKQARLILDRLDLNGLIPSLRSDAAAKPYAFEVKRAENVPSSPLFDISVVEENLADPSSVTHFEPWRNTQDLDVQFDEEPQCSQDISRVLTPPRIARSENDTQLSESQRRKRRVYEDDHENCSKKRKLNETTHVSQNLDNSRVSEKADQKFPTNLFLCEDNNANDEDFEL